MRSRGIYERIPQRPTSGCAPCSYFCCLLRQWHDDTSTISEPEQPLARLSIMHPSLNVYLITILQPCPRLPVTHVEWLSPIV